MKHIALTLFGLLLTLFTAYAQYLPSRMDQVRGSLINESGEELSDQEVFLYVGQDVFSDTYIGAKRQYRTGSGLLTGGLIAVGAGTAVSTLSYFVFINSLADIATSKSGKVSAVPLLMGYEFMYVGLGVAVTGFQVLSAGIILKNIGRHRLQWVADDYNGKSPVSLHFGAGQYGTGLVLNF